MSITLKICITFKLNATKFIVENNLYRNKLFSTEGYNKERVEQYTNMPIKRNWSEPKKKIEKSENSIDKTTYSLLLCKYEFIINNKIKQHKNNKKRKIHINSTFLKRD